MIRKQANVLQSGRDGGTPELRKKIKDMDAIHMGHSPEGVARVQNLVQVPIDYYAQRGWLTPRQYDAAEEFYRCWYYGGDKSMHGISKYDPNGGGGRTPMTSISSCTTSTRRPRKPSAGYRRH
jgi:hypothetical protein